MRILVTGAGGRLARYVVPALYSRGDSLALLDKNAEAVREALKKEIDFGNGQRVQIMQADLAKPGDEPVIAQAARGCDAVVHLAALVDYTASRTQLFEVNAEGTRRVCEAAKAAGVKRLVFVSSTSVYRKPRFLPINERHPIAPANAYGESKAAAEKIVRESGVPFVILRLALIYGPGFDEGFRTIVENVKRGRQPVIGSGKNRIALVHARDAARAILAALDKSEALGQDFIIASDEVVTQRQALDEVARCLGVPAPRQRVPKALAYLMARLVKLKAWVLERKPSLLPEHVATLAENRFYDVSKAERLLGWRASERFARALPEVIESFEASAAGD
jgi:nucleoside-diphosphate-sugar epimerase